MIISQTNCFIDTFTFSPSKLKRNYVERVKDEGSNQPGYRYILMVPPPNLSYEGVYLP